MAEIFPFRALHYHPEKVGELSRVITQPYDKITPEMQARYYGLSPYNLARVIRGRQTGADTPLDNVYSRAARDFRNWVEDGVLVSNVEPAIYPYYQEYSIPGQPSIRKQRRGFIALCRLEDYSAGVVHRHEETLSGPKADRLELLKATRAHFGQLFMLYSDPAGSVESALAVHTKDEVWESVGDEFGCRHSVWRVTDGSTQARVVEAMRDRKLVIADGHHRYETALAYRDLCRRHGLPDSRAEHVMMTFVRKETEGLTVLPTHRVVHDLKGFNWQEFRAAAARFFELVESDSRGAASGWGPAFFSRLAEAGRERPALGAYAGQGRLALLRLRRDLDLASALPDLFAGLRRLDVVILHRLLLEQTLGIDRQAVREERNLGYVREFEDAVERVGAGRGQVAFLMNPTPVDAVWENALAGHPLPQKSTDFYPKLLSGLAVYWLDNPAGI
jgi:uncharacterized protein (DUF1015 family)